MTDRGALLYLDLLERCVTNLIDEDPAIRHPWDESSDERYLPFDREKREQARDWPSQAHTMIGTQPSGPGAAPRPRDRRRRRPG